MAILTLENHNIFAYRPITDKDRGIFPAQQAKELYPNCGHISLIPLIEKAGYSTPDLIALLQSQSERGLWLTGSTLACTMGISTPRVKPILAPADLFGQATGIPIPQSEINRAVARLHSDLSSATDIDLLASDIPESVHLNTMYCYQKTFPERLIISSYDVREGLSVSITANDPASIHTVWGTSIDLLRAQVNPNLSVVVPQQSVQLSVDGLSKHSTDTDAKALRVARHFIVQSLSVKDGKRISVNFGKTILESTMLNQFLTNNLTQIFRQKMQ